MSEFKKYEAEENKLKKADAKKASAADPSATVSELVGAKKSRVSAAMTPVSVRKNKKLPVVFDVIVAIVMLALVAGLFVGSYMLFKYYSNDYTGVNVRYTVVYEGENMHTFAALTNEELFCDIDGNSVYMGKVKEVKIEKGDNAQQLILTVELDGVRYKKSEGYFVSDQRLAVGSEFTFRHVEKTFDGTVVELAKADKGGK